MTPTEKIGLSLAAALLIVQIITAWQLLLIRNEMPTARMMPYEKDYCTMARPCRVEVVK